MRSQSIAQAIGILPARRRFRACSLLLPTFVLAAVGGPRSWGQALATAEARTTSGMYVGFGGMKTHVEDFTFNALGVDAGLYIQPFAVLGAEVKGGTYPLYARFTQTPVTAGVHLGPRSVPPHHLQMFAYFGGGMSKAQNAGPYYLATPAKWSPCWQASEGLDIPLGRFKFQVYEATWTETYSPLRSLGSFSLNTGFVYTFR